MSSYAEAQQRKAHEAANTPEARVASNRCPVCPGDLDTGFECTECGYDAMQIALNKEPKP